MAQVYTHMHVIQEHDGFCDALHLDGVVFPVAPVFNPATGAQWVIMPGKITATQKNVSTKWLISAVSLLMTCITCQHSCF